MSFDEEEKLTEENKKKQNSIGLLYSILTKNDEKVASVLREEIELDVPINKHDAFSSDSKY